MTAELLARRGTSNSAVRGNSEDRRRRRVYLVTTYRANVDADVLTPHFVFGTRPVALGQGHAACRCYRCGYLLTVETVTVDRIIPGCLGGTYRRDNIRPACLGCNSSTGAALATRKGKK